MTQTPQTPTQTPRGTGPQRFLLVASSLAITETLALLFEPVHKGLLPLGPIISLFVAAIVWRYSERIISWWIALLQKQSPLVGNVVSLVLSLLVGAVFFGFMMKVSQSNVVLSIPFGLLVGFIAWLLLRPK
jgi:hypothetical protein